MFWKLLTDIVPRKIGQVLLLLPHEYTDKTFFSLLKRFSVLEYCVLKWVVKKSWKSGFCNKALPIWEIYPPVLIRRVKYCFSALDKDDSGAVVEIGYGLSDTPYRYGNGVEVLGT